MRPPDRNFLQLSLDDLGTPLSQVTFCVIDLETTGGSSEHCAITEIGAVKLRGGECIGTFQTLVNPGCAIPPQITVLTGITHSMLVPAPRIESVLPALLEFIGDAVIVGHNVRFDLSFVQAALTRDQRPRLTNRSVDTVALARRLVRNEVPNCKLGTLAERLRLEHKPSHRALDDALATGDLLHLLIERAGGLGVTGLDDLLSLPKMAGHPSAQKLRLTDDLPRSPGVYLFKNSRGDVLYVGKATNLRARVRSYFSGDDRRKIGSLLRETASIDHVVHPHPLSAAVHEIRLIHQYMPGYNRRLKDWSRYVYVKLTLAESFPRLSIVKDVRDDNALYLGPLFSRSTAQRVVDAIHTSIPLRRCAGRVGKRALRDAPCTASQLGVSLCPCAGGVDPEEYRQVVERAVRGLTVEPELLLEPLAERIALLASEERFEEAGDVRDRANALASAIARQRRFDQLRHAGRLQIDLGPLGGVILDHGRLQSAWGFGELPALNVLSQLPHHLIEHLETSAPLDRELADELGCISAWLDRTAPELTIDHCEGVLASVLPSLRSFTPKKAMTVDDSEFVIAARRSRR
ncbi:MAG: DEDD exonuclease domain-containing protein [Acidimicrobiales bacterium]